MTKIITKEEFISAIAEKASFTKSDVEKILNAMREVFIEAIENEWEIKVKNFFRLYTQHLGERKITKGENAGTVYPPVTRNILKLSEKIRFADREENDN